MMQQFLQIIQSLKDDPYYAVMIESMDNGAVLTPPESVVPPAKPSHPNSWTGAVILRYYPDIETFFNQIAEKHSKIRITFRRKNGTTYKTIADKVFDLKGNSQEQNPKPETLEVVEQPKSTPMLAGPQGLSFADASKIHNYDKLEKELAEVKAELKAERGKKSKLKKKLLISETLDHKSDQRNQSYTKLLETLGPLAMPFIERLAGGAMPTAPGMGQPGQPNGISTFTHNQQVMVIATNGLDDELTYYLALFAQNISNPDLQNDLLELIKKYKLDPETPQE